MNGLMNLGITYDEYAPAIFWVNLWCEFRGGANDFSDQWKIVNGDVKNRRSVCESCLEEIIMFAILIGAASCLKK